VALDRPYAITTASGRSLDLADPRPDAICVEDIASALSKICRFGAQATEFYSVAQHAIEVSVHVDDDLRLPALHHDSHEAFAGDLPTPLKKLLRKETKAYDRLCERLDNAIGSALGVDPDLFKSPTVKRADETVLASECCGLLPDQGRAIRRAMPHRSWLAVGPIQRDGLFGRIVSPADAEAAFLEAHKRYAAGLRYDPAS